MRTNVAGFALTFAMGLVVLLIGFLALSAGGLVQLGPAEEVAAEAAASDSLAKAPTARLASDVVTYRATLPADAQVILVGDALFKNNCAQCHAVNDKVVGPALAGITKRRGLPWIISWVHNSSKVIASGDAYAVALYEANGKQQMPAFPQLSDEDIRIIVAYVSVQMSAAGNTSAVAAR